MEKESLLSVYLTLGSLECIEYYVDLTPAREKWADAETYSCSGVNQLFSGYLIGVRTWGRFF